MGAIAVAFQQSTGHLRTGGLGELQSLGQMASKARNVGMTERGDGNFLRGAMNGDGLKRGFLRQHVHD